MNFALKKRIKSYDMKRLIVSSLILGIISGFALGIGEASLYISSNRYFGLGMYNIAFSYLRSTVNYFSLILPLAFVTISLATLFTYFILSNFLKDEVKGEKNAYHIVATLLLTGFFLLVGYKFNKSIWYPPFFSIEGILYNLAFTLFFIFIGFIVLKNLSRIRGFISFIVSKTPRLMPLALMVAFLLMILNTAFYYNQLKKDRSGLNVLLITADTLRADHLSPYGYVRDTSPNIDNLAKEGVLFHQAVVQWPKTAPSFASMLTSTYGHYNGVIRITPQKINTYFVLLPEILKNADYNTVSVVTNGTLGTPYNFNQGIDTHIETWLKYESTDASYVTEYALSWLKRNSGEGKFFMWLHYLDPHARYEPPEPYNEMYVGDKHYDDSRKTKLNSGISEDIGGVPGRAHLRDRTEVGYYIAQYDAEIRYMDDNIGKVLDAIKTMGLSDNTVIIFTADHGESLGDHNYYFAHGRLPYDDCVRVPLIIKIPGLKPENKVVDQPVELINIMPTVLDILNIPINKEAQGRSLVPLMLGNRDSIPEYAFTESGFKLNYQRMIHSKGWKLIYVPDKDDQGIMRGMPFELYNVENDPHELNNLVNVESGIASELKRELFKWMESANGVNELPPPEGNVKVDKKTEDNLKALGYIE